MKRLKLGIILLTLALFLSSCKNSQEDEIVVREKPVMVKKLKVETHQKTIPYIAIVHPKNIIKKSFLSGGKIVEIFVKTGDRVKNGDKLAKIDPENAELAERDSNIKSSQASENYKKSLDYYNFLKKQYEDTKKLYETGALAKKELDELELKLKSAGRDLNLAKSALNSASIGQKHTSTQRENTTMINDIDAVVLEVLQKEGEVVGAGYPVIILSSDEKTLKLGLSLDDSQKVKKGDFLIAKIKDKDEKLEIISIKSAPDEATSTYELTAELPSDTELRIGEMIDVKIPLGKNKGIWVDINKIQNDGYDYVYIVRNKRAEKKIIEIISYDNEKALVKGLEEDDLLIISGQNTITDGQRIKITKDNSLEEK